MIGLQAINKLLINSVSSDRCADCVGWCSLLGPHSGDKTAQQQISPLDLAFCAPCSPPPRTVKRARASLRSPLPFSLLAFAYFAVPVLVAVFARCWRTANEP